MFVRNSSRLMTVIRPSILIAALAIPSWADSPIRIGSVPPEYTPTAGSEMPEPVSMEGFTFQIEPETDRARIEVDYTYPDRANFEFERGAGPQPTFTQLPGLKYDVAARTVVYDQGGKKSVCARVRDRKFLFWKSIKVQATGACVVTSRVTTHAEDDGWRIRHISSLDTYLELR
jgi:hypothetical protein